jgi:hypothetical protein
MTRVLRIREASVDDTEAIVSATVDGWQTAYRGIVDDERLDQLPLDRWRREVGQGLRNPSRRLLSHGCESQLRA